MHSDNTQGTIGERFKELVEGCQRRGPRLIAESVREPEKFLRVTRYSLPVQHTLREMSPDEIARLMTVIGFAVEVSFAALLSELNDGDDGLTYRLVARDEESGAESCLVGGDDYIDVSRYLAAD